MQEFVACSDSVASTASTRAAHSDGVQCFAAFWLARVLSVYLEVSLPVQQLAQALAPLGARSCKLASCKDTSIMPGANATCSRLSIAQFAAGPKRSMGHVPGAENSIL